VMNGFQRDIRDKLLSRTPHLIASGTHQLEDDVLMQPLLALKKSEKFYHTKMLIPELSYLQITVIFSDAVEYPTISSALLSYFHRLKPFSVIFFKDKKVLGQSIPSSVTINPELSVKDEQLAVFLPLRSQELFKGLFLYPMQGLWFLDPMKAAAAKTYLQEYYPSVSFIAWQDTYASLFEALNSEKRLIFIVLSLLIVLIYVQLALTLLLVFKDKEKDSVALFFFLEGISSIYKVFFIYGLLNVFFGTVFGCLGGWFFAQWLPSMVQLLEQCFHATVLPYDQYYSTTLPSDVHFSDVVFIGGSTFVAGIVACHFIVKSVCSKKIDQLLRYHQ